MSDVFVVTVAVLIASEKVTEMVELLETEVAESAGEVDKTVGAVVSMMRSLLLPREPEAPEEGNVRFAVVPFESLIDPLFNAPTVVADVVITPLANVVPVRSPASTLAPPPYSNQAS